MEEILSQEGEGEWWMREIESEREKEKWEYGGGVEGEGMMNGGMCVE